MTGINPKARAAALRCLEAGTPLLVPADNPSADAAVDDARRFLDLTQANIGRMRLYEVAPLSHSPQEEARSVLADRRA